MSQFTFYAKRPYENYHKIDMWLLVSMLLLWGLGLFTLFVTSQNYATILFGDPLQFFKNQLRASIVGFGAFFLFLFLDMKYIKKLLPIMLFASFILCVVALTMEDKNGAHRWISIGKFTFQPSELAKIAIVLFLANYFEKQENLPNPEEKNVFPCVVVFLAFLVVILIQKDFSTAVLVAVIGILLFFVSGAKIAWLIPFIILAFPAAFFLIALEPYRLSRVIGWIRPDEFASSINYQSIAAKRAISAGGFWGEGIGVGLTKINNIPEVQADYIFAGWVEAMGFVGVIFFLAILIFFAYRGYRTAFNCKTRFTAYGTFGCVSVIFIQSLVNIMVVCGMLPSTGIPLPFFSLGGSSILVTFMMCGFILNSSRCEESYEKNEENDDINIESLTYL